MPFYEELVDATSTERDYFLSAPIISDVMAGHFNLDTYLAFLHQAYHHVRHTVPLLETARSNLGADQQWMEPSLTAYIAEESGHEAWILDDIEACGESRNTWANRPPGFHTEMMVAYLYDVAQRVNPAGIFGMVLVLEGTSSSLAPAVAKIVQEHLDLPDTAMTYLTTHGELDQTHIAHFEAVMNRVSSEEDRAAIIHAANNVYRLYGNVYRDIPSGAALTAEAA
ncbi:TenA family transcriptional regulator [Congregibacter sp.]|uniref:TenA family transcriptional regulator n=1 Tax=Congregibacter sp. TaxID=2744308 RepID=UPI003F6D9ED0